MIGGRLFRWSASVSPGDVEREASALALAWAGLRARGETGWTQQALAAARVIATGADDATPCPPPVRKAQTLYAAAERWTGSLRAARVSIAHARRADDTLRLLKSLLPNLPLEQVTPDTLLDLRERLCAHRYKGKPLSSATIQTTPRYWRALFRHLEDSAAWTAQRRWERLLSGRLAGVTRPTPKAVDLDTLSLMYGRANPRLRGCILLALNCGFGAKDISDLQQGEISQKGGRWYIQRHRQKTGVRGCWLLWAETVSMLLPLMDTPADARLVTTRNGTPLVCDSPNGKRIDAVAREWNRTRSKAGLPASTGGFYALRKTAATMVAAEAGEDAASRFLCHAPTTVASRHYIADDPVLLKPMHDATEAVRVRLEALFNETQKSVRL